MNNSQVFKLAHKKAKADKSLCKKLAIEFNYQVAFSYHLKNIINSLPQKVTIYSGINRGVAMVGDYKKPNIIQTFVAVIFILIQNILDSEKALRIRYPITFAHYDAKSIERQKAISDYNNKINL